MANTRYKGANSSERLTISTLSDSDMFQTRHLPGTVNDADKGVSKSLLQAVPVAICATAAATAAKVGTLAAESFPDFVLVNGRTVHVYFSAANTASVPTLNLAGTGAIPITYPNGDYVGAWSAGTSMELMYISITDGNTTIERWVLCSELPVDAVTADNMHSVTSNAVANSINALDFKEETYFNFKSSVSFVGKQYRLNGIAHVIGVITAKQAIAQYESIATVNNNLIIGLFSTIGYQDQPNTVSDTMILNRSGNGVISRKAISNGVRVRIDFSYPL